MKARIIAPWVALLLLGGCAGGEAGLGQSGDVLPTRPDAATASPSESEEDARDVQPAQEGCDYGLVIAIAMADYPVDVLFDWFDQNIGYERSDGYLPGADGAGYVASGEVGGEPEVFTDSGLVPSEGAEQAFAQAANDGVSAIRIGVQYPGSSSDDIDAPPFEEIITVAAQSGLFDSYVTYRCP